jgi:hypothetical protein
MSFLRQHRETGEIRAVAARLRRAWEVSRASSPRALRTPGVPMRALHYYPSREIAYQRGRRPDATPDA